MTLNGARCGHQEGCQTRTQKLSSSTCAAGELSSGSPRVDWGLSSSVAAAIPSDRAERADVASPSMADGRALPTYVVVEDGAEAGVGVAEHLVELGGEAELGGRRRRGAPVSKLGGAAVLVGQFLAEGRSLVLEEGSACGHCLGGDLAGHLQLLVRVRRQRGRDGQID